jgi:peptide-methionine (S)-S-oxide reductase
MRPGSVIATVAAVFIVVTAGQILEGWSIEPGTPGIAIPGPAVDETPGPDLRTAVFAGGCFWGVQAVFQHVDGVESAISGYAGGTVSDPTYQQVSSGTTGHAESVLVTYDPGEVSYGRLLQIFFSVAHDPTQLNRQGPDYGTQYRSAIYTTTDEQQSIAAAYVRQLDDAKVYGSPIVTQLKPLDMFYRAEDYHQDYATLHPDQPYIVWNDAPKVAALAGMFPDVWRASPRLVSGGA